MPMRLSGAKAARLLLTLCPLTALAAAGLEPAGRCKAFPGTDSWPSATGWESLKQALGGRLLAPPPPAAACHAGQPTYDSEACAKAQAGWSTFEWHAQNPVSAMWDQFSNYSCLPQPHLPCSGQGYPPYVVDAASAEDVQVAVRFARERGVRLVVKNTGHDFMGRAIAPGALSIWTHHLNSTEYHAGRFQLAGSGRVVVGNAVTVGAGAQMEAIYGFLDRYNQTIVGGSGRTVGVAGYVAGGGHSVLAPRHGLAADNVLQMGVVTPQGEKLVVNEDQGRDLFWALRGGGGSTFGVITNITMRTHSTPPMTRIFWRAVTAVGDPVLEDLVSFVASKLPEMSDAGISGYNQINKRTPNPNSGPGEPADVIGFRGRNVIQGADGAARVEAIYRPIRDGIAQRWPGKVNFTLETKQYGSFKAWFEENADPSSAGVSAYAASRLLDRRALTGNATQLGRALQAGAAPSTVYSLFLVAGRGVAEAGRRVDGAAVHPAWRTAYVQAASLNPFASNETAWQEAKKRINAAWQPLRDLTPGSGAYSNEALPFEKDWQRTFWGDNYARLAAIKKRVDPDDVFWCSPCVGNEGWREQPDGRLCRVAGGNETASATVH